jgi:hypothetical protein
MPRIHAVTLKRRLKDGDKRIALSSTIHTQKNLPPPIKEHTHKLKMEQKLKLIAAEEEKESYRFSRFKWHTMQFYFQLKHFR